MKTILLLSALFASPLAGLGVNAFATTEEAPCASFAKNEALGLASGNLAENLEIKDVAVKYLIHRSSTELAKYEITVTYADKTSHQTFDSPVYKVFVKVSRVDEKNALITCEHGSDK